MAREYGGFSNVAIAIIAYANVALYVGAMSDTPQTSANARTVREQSLGWHIQTLAAEMNARMDQELDPLGITRHQFGVLMILLDQEGLSQAEIGKRINLPGYATTRGMDALEAKGLVERRADAASRRAYRVFLTATGRALGPSLFAIVGRVNGSMTAGLTPDQRAALLDGMRAISAQIRPPSE